MGFKTYSFYDLNQLLNAYIERYTEDISYLLNTNITNAQDLNIKYLPFYLQYIKK